MTKPKPKHKESKPMTGAIATQKAAELPAEVMDDIFADAGKGAEGIGREDMVIPFLKIAEALSPEVNKRDPAYIPGLEAGDFFNTATQTVYKGEEGFIFIPAYYERKFLEWKPNREGFAGERDASVMDEVERGEREGRWGNYLPNGNTISETAVWYGLAVDNQGNTEQVVLSLSGTRLKASRQLATKLKSVGLKRPDGKGVFNPPLFYNQVRVTSVPENNDKGSWFVFKFELAGSTHGTLVYSQAKQINNAVATGAVKAAQSHEHSADDQVPF